MEEQEHGKVLLVYNFQDDSTEIQLLLIEKCQTFLRKGIPVKINVPVLHVVKGFKCLYENIVWLNVYLE